MVSTHHAVRAISSLRRVIDQIQAPDPSGMASAKMSPMATGAANEETGRRRGRRVELARIPQSTTVVRIYRAVLE